MKKIAIIFLTSFLLISISNGCQPGPAGAGSGSGIFQYLVFTIVVLICGIPLFLQWRKRKKMQLTNPEKVNKKDPHIVKRDAIIMFVFGIVLIIISQTITALKYHRPNSSEENYYYIVLFLGILCILVGAIYYAYSGSKEKKE
jgi:uncharacterized membrane protein